MARLTVPEPSGIPEVVHRTKATGELGIYVIPMWKGTKIKMRKLRTKGGFQRANYYPLILSGIRVMLVVEDVELLFTQVLESTVFQTEIYRDIFQLERVLK